MNRLNTGLAWLVPVSSMYWVLKLATNILLYSLAVFAIITILCNNAITTTINAS